MDTDKLRAFLQIVESGSVQGAARALGMTRGALRHSLDGLEAELGASLLHRDARGVRLTAAGAVVVEQGRSLLRTATALAEEVRAAGSEATGVIRVIEPVGLPLAMHVSVLLAAHLALPRQQLRIRHVEDPVAHRHEPFELLLHEGPPPELNDWFSRVVARVQLRAMAAPDYLASRGTPASLAQLAEHEILGWQRPGHRADEWPLLGGGVVKVSPWLSSTDPHLLHTLASRGGGVVLAVNLPYGEGEGALTPVLEDQIGGDLVFRVTTPFPARADSRTRDTLALIIEQLEHLPRD